MRTLGTSPVTSVLKQLTAIVRRPWIHAPAIALLLLLITSQLGPFNFYTFLITVIMLYSIAVFGLNIPGGMLGQLSLGQGAAFGIGAYVAAVMTTTHGWPMLYTLPFALIIGIVAGLIMGAPAARLDVLGLGMISLGVTLIFGDLVTGLSFTGGPSGLTVPSISFSPGGPLLLAGQIFDVVVVVAVLAYLAHWYLRLSNFGRVALAIKVQELGATALGVNAYVYKVAGFALGTGFGALGGALYAYVQGIVSPEAFGPELSILFLLMVILGGAGTRIGPALGIGVVGILPILLARYPDIDVYLYGALLILVMRILPQGLVRRSSAPAPNWRLATPKLGKSGKAPTGTLIEITEVSRSFGGVKALTRVSLPIAAGAVTAIVGPNGSGKTTLLNAVAGYYPPQEGEIRLLGRRINGLAPYSIARLGVSRTFQVPKVFPVLSVGEHLALAVHYRGTQSNIEYMQIADKFLRMQGIGPEFESRDAGTLASGQLRFLEIAMAILRHPIALLLDEPAAGLSAVEMEHLIDLLRLLASAGLAVVVVEHHLDLVRRAADRVAVMHTGQVLWSGPPSELQRSQAVREAYLGTGKC